MRAKSWFLTLGLGAAAGAVAIMMLPRQNPARRMVCEAADRMEDTVTHMADSIMH